MLVHELYPDKEIYQLQGGIQRYIETCSEQQQKQQQKQEQEEDSNNNATKTNPSYFVGKNFVSNLQRRLTLAGTLRKKYGF